MISGKERRLRRVMGADARTLLVAVDHALTTGGAGGLSRMSTVLGAVVAGGADGIVVHRGSAATSMPVQRDTAMIVHLSGNTRLSPGGELKTRVCDPETALTLGADLVSVHVTFGGGHQEDRAALADLGKVAASCDRLGLPLLVMTYVAGAGESPAERGAAVIHAGRAVAELGADIVKVAHPGAEHLDELVASIEVPVVLAGGEAAGGWEEYVTAAKDAIGHGVAGLCVGRRVFGSPDPAAAVAELRAVVHGAAGVGTRSAGAGGHPQR
ncbi:fructose-bisphosphate aldolase [Streptomyces sp. LX-29]|uniref:class I fructose-bisphosphate aldolase n=1 Tax=Streptomyces sp. LX-29 TaxID=2900152 RepID=UPI00240DA312|nr:fructose-bisphosphate aldolase [Streptomyces sp. LX-29]WFB10754.1 fructose-bisphosphate aldolase [Streptomyces sp. LX-29]